MVNFRQRPFPEGTARNRLAAKRRAAASEYSSAYAVVPTQSNDDEKDFAGQTFVASFTKGLSHDGLGQLSDEADYVGLVDHINEQDAENFDRVRRGLGDESRPLTRRDGGAADGCDIAWRGWESPRAGHYFELQGPDADAVGMPPAPELGSEELSAEMAEVYALALLRDVPFPQIADGSGADPCTAITAAQVLDAMSGLSWFGDADASALTLQQRRRRAARRVDPQRDSDDRENGYDVDDPPDELPFDRARAFRGSGPASKAGPYVSQFMLLGNTLTPAGGTRTHSSIAYGRQVIDQTIETLAAGRDFLIHWNAYVDVQNGADFRDDTGEQIVRTRRFITTPRDLAAYVRYDALYQAYLNACLYMLGEPTFAVQGPVNHPYSGKPGPGLPDGNRGATPDRPESRQAFALFGGPHVLSLVTEVATRCLKAVRRQKFNYHRRARPERIGALLTLKGTEGNGAGDRSGALGATVSARLATMSNAMNLGPMLSLVNAHNASRLASGGADPHLDFSVESDPDWFGAAENYLLPMAFAEGSPMHPSYGAGHATVAGGCVTMLKAFFATTDENGDALPWPAELPVLQATSDGSGLVDAPDREGMTIGGELNKLAANISIGRNMAGVHYYTDYYESLRMGERIATGMLIEQMKHYNEPLELSFESFDGDHVHILKNDYDSADPRVHVHDAKGRDIGLDAWWHRHQKGETVAEARVFAVRKRSLAEFA